MLNVVVACSFSYHCEHGPRNDFIVGRQGPIILHKKYKYRPIQNIHHRPIGLDIYK